MLSVYPASVYIILFGLSLAPFVDLVPGSQGRVKIYKDKAGGYLPHIQYSTNEIPAAFRIRIRI
jgi:hypothetical protein